MIILAIDTCFSRCAACLYDSAKNQALGIENEAMERGHAEFLAPMVQRILAKASIAANQIDRIAVTTGPGTFTGLRIGLSFARAFGRALNIPVSGIDTLKAVQLAIPAECQPLIIAHKAGQSGYYYILQSNISANIELLKLEDLSECLESKSQWVFGTGAPDIESHYKHLELRRNPQHDLPNLVQLAQFASQQKAETVLPDPVYIREPDAKPQAAPNPVLRKAEFKDFESLSKIHQASFDHGWSPTDLSQMQSTPGTTTLLMEHAGQPAAFIIVRQMFDEAEILTIATLPSHRRHGHALALVKAAQAQNLAKLYLEVAASNQTAQALYHKLGFEKSGFRKAYYAKASGTAEDAVLMVWQKK